MGATRSTLAAEVDRIIGNRGLAATACVSWVQRAHQMFQGMVEVPESKAFATVTVVENALSTALPADFYSVKAVTHDNGERLTQVSIQRYDTLDKTVMGRLTHYATDNDTLETWPKADDDYELSLRYRRRLPLMATDGATTECAEEFDTPILYMAVALGLMDFGEHDAAARFEAAAARIVATIQHRQPRDLDDRNEPLGVTGLVT